MGAVLLLNLVTLVLLATPDLRIQDGLLRRHAATRAPDPDIVLLDIDERSLAAFSAEFGAWPWPRSVFGELIEKLEAQKPAAIVFDLLFTDPQRGHEQDDAYFIEQTAAASNVFLPMSALPGVPEGQGVPLAEYGARLGVIRTPDAQPEARLPLLLPLAGLAETGRLGLIDVTADPDGVVRRYRVYLEHRGWRVDSLPGRVARALNWKLPQADTIEIHWRGAAGARPAVSFSDLFFDLERRHPQRPADEFSGKILVVGATAAGLNDLHATPLSGQQAGPEILAAALETLKHGDALRRPPWWFQVLPGCIVSLLLLAGARRAWGLLPLGAGALSFVPLWLAAVYAALSWNWVLPVLPPLAALAATYLGLALAQYLRERRARAHAVAVFSRFVNPRVVETLVASPADPLALPAQSRMLTVLFSDIRGFTSFSETRPPEAVVDLLNRYFARQVEVVFRHGGTVDKFIGDAIMAFWGAPREDAEQARHAVAAALDMARVAAEFAREAARQGVAFDIGIGVHSGPAVVGFVGSPNKLDYTAIGDTVNLASRIEGLTKGVARILVSEQTRTACGAAFVFVDRGEFRAKGRERPVRLFEPLRSSAPESAPESAPSHEARIG
ncbi:MAG: adenylate/guanylate cyclase domain-containing protein [Sinobacteraceae bacterium]|nr:adenylate/guanylate cyclase domain-containing protein [Nevskiaceae bacterium]